MSFDEESPLYFGCPPGAELNNPEFTELLIGYAHAMWAWSRLEAGLFHIFADAVEPTTNNHSKALRAAFFSIISAKSRLDMIHSVARTMWEGEPHWQEWSKLYNDCVKQLKVRGRIAHLIGYGYREAGKTILVPVLAEAIYHPSAPRERKHLKQIGVPVSELAGYVHTWKMLGERLNLFRLLVREQAQPQASPEHIARLRQVLQTLTDQTHKAPSAPPKPSRRKSSRKEPSRP